MQGPSLGIAAGAAQGRSLKQLALPQKEEVEPKRIATSDLSVRAPDGRGVRYNQDGSFYSLLEPNK